MSETVRIAHPEQPHSVDYALAALTDKPNDPALLLQLARAYNHEKRFDEALDAIRRRMATGAVDVTGCVGAIGIAARSGDLGVAEYFIRRTLELNPVQEQALGALGLLQLRRRDYDAGWRNYAYRRYSPAFKDRLPRDDRLEWTGQDLTDRSILVVSEQGLGDGIMFARYVPVLQKMGAKVVVMGSDPLERLFKHAWPETVFIRQTEKVPHTDFAVHAIDITAVLGDTFEADPLGGRPYLKPLPTEAEIWQKRLSEHPRPRVGFVWAGNPKHALDFNRSMKLEELRPILSVPDIGFYSFQRDEARKEILRPRRWGGQLIEMGSAFKDLVETAAAMVQMDLMITVDSGLAHLAGALGVPVWMFCPNPPDWRWGDFGARYPWYPTMRIYRQTAYRDWSGSVLQVAEDLTRWRQLREAENEEAAFLKEQAVLLRAGRSDVVDAERLAAWLETQV